MPFLLRLRLNFDRTNVSNAIGRLTAAADELVVITMHPNLRWRWLTQETKRAGRTGVCPRLKNAHKIPYFRAGKHDASREDIQRRAKGTNDVDYVFRRRI
jgi:hypothetical protein